LKQLIAAIACILLAACNEDQDPQNRYDTFAASVAPWPSSSAALNAPEGTVAVDEPQRSLAARQPPQVTPALLARGRERFGIFCSPCHGFDGYADGIIVARGFPHPPSFHSPQLRAAPAQLFFDTITNGYGAMYSYADRVPAADRWAIVAYIRALQLSQLQNGSAGR
jgi:mono/diheme cytochrome c family protein